MATTVRPRCFLDIQHGTDPIGRVVVELFTDKTPKTCENFRALCTASKSAELSYKSTIFHRVIEEFMIQGGDITRGDGKGGMSIYGETFEDENLGWCDIDKEGLVCMANRGKDTNSSQFFITCAPCDHLNGKHTVFGHVVAGMQFIKQIETVKVDSSDKPTLDVIIANCGELEFRRAAAPMKTKAPVDTRSRDRKRLRSRSRSRDRSRSRSRSRSASDTSRHGGNKDRDTERDRSRTRSRSPRGKSDRHKRRRDARPSRRHHRSRSPHNDNQSKASTSPQVTRGTSRSRSPGESASPVDQRRDWHSSRHHHRSRRAYSRSRSRSHDRYRSRREYDDYDSEEERRVQREEEERESVRRQQQQQQEQHYQRSNRSPPRRYDRYVVDDSGQEVKFKGRGSMKYREKGGWGGGYNRYGRLI
ncbi:hypothetical protein TWF696_009067 [Orbilia brochopaga]|uniref:peptidylprolyl isomerase n=1 Tax=Orbilia brochopaga TaxID=3140254 RepID=A0AAV9UJJ3_9PEZI